METCGSYQNDNNVLGFGLETFHFELASLIEKEDVTGLVKYLML